MRARMMRQERRQVQSRPVMRWPVLQRAGALKEQTDTRVSRTLHSKWQGGHNPAALVRFTRNLSRRRW